MRMTFVSKTARQTNTMFQSDSSTGQNVISLAPSDYGIDFIDRGSIMSNPGSKHIQTQRKTNKGLQRRGRLGLGRTVILRKADVPENRTGMPDQLKTGLEILSGISMDDVRIHYNSSKPAEINAYAYTLGRDIHIAPRQEKHLPHEGWHMVQQMLGRVRPTMRTKETTINDDARLEREADVMGRRAIVLQCRTRVTERPHHMGPSARCMQDATMPTQTPSPTAVKARGVSRFGPVAQRYKPPTENQISSMNDDYKADNLMMVTVEGGRLPSLYFTKGGNTSRARQTHRTGPALTPWEPWNEYYFRNKDYAYNAKKLLKDAEDLSVRRQSWENVARQTYSMTDEPQEAGGHIQIKWYGKQRKGNPHLSGGLVYNADREYKDEECRYICASCKVNMGNEDLDEGAMIADLNMKNPTKWRVP